MNPEDTESQNLADHGKHPKKNRALVYLAAVVMVCILGFAGWTVLSGKTNTSSTTYVADCSVTIPANKSSKLPNGWALYEIRDIGIKYFYPANWGNPTTITNSGSQKYEADFTDKSVGANVAVLLSPDCSDINSANSQTQDKKVATKIIKQDKSSYSTITHWTSNKGNQYKLTIYNVVSVGSINSAAVSYSVIAGKEICPDDKLAAVDQPKCINQTTSDMLDQVVKTLQEI